MQDGQADRGRVDSLLPAVGCWWELGNMHGSAQPRVDTPFSQIPEALPQDSQEARERSSSSPHLLGSVHCLVPTLVFNEVSPQGMAFQRLLSSQTRSSYGYIEPHLICSTPKPAPHAGAQPTFFFPVSAQSLEPSLDALGWQ